MFLGSFQSVRIQGKIPLMILPNPRLCAEASFRYMYTSLANGKMLLDVLKSHRIFALALRRPGVSSEISMPARLRGLDSGLCPSTVWQVESSASWPKMVQYTGAARYKPYRIEQMESTGEEAVGLSRFSD